MPLEEAKRELEKTMFERLVAVNVERAAEEARGVRRRSELGILEIQILRAVNVSDAIWLEMRCPYPLP